MTNLICTAVKKNIHDAVLMASRQPW